MELSEKQKLNFIEASYHTVPDLEPENSDFVLNLMTQRFNNSKRSFLLLYTHHYTFDAMLIAGYMMELLAQMIKIRKNRTEKAEIYGKAAYEQIQIMLAYPEEENEIQWEKNFQQWIMVLEQYASKVFNQKDDILSILKNNALTRQKKLEQLNKQEDIFQHPVDIQKDINYFVRYAKKVLSSHKMPIDNIRITLRTVYRLYCNYKHSNLLSLVHPSIDLASFVMILSVVEYYDYFGNIDLLLKTYALFP